MLNESNAMCCVCSQKIEKKFTNWIILQMVEEKTTQPALLVKRDVALSYECYEKKISQLLVTTLRSNEVIFNEIFSEFTDVDFQSTAFVRALVTAFTNSSLDKYNKLHDSKLKKFTPILSIFVDKTKEFELEALLAVQSIGQKIRNFSGINSPSLSDLF